MINPVIIELLKKTHQYYPIGMPYLCEHYEGYRQLRQIIENKINTLTEKDTLEPWDTMVRHISQVTTYNHIYNESYHQFPNYFLRIELSNSVGEEVKSVRCLCVSVSLLVNYFTVFYEMDLTVHRFLSEEEKLLPEWKLASELPKKFILYGEQHSNEDEKSKLTQIKSLITQYFPKHKFIPHELLFAHHVRGGVPYGEGIESTKDQYALYQYLFGHYYFADKTEVVK